MFGRFVIATFFLISFAAEGWSQDPNTTYGGFCPPGSTPSGGGGYTCVCPDGSLAGINGCSGGSQPPQQQGNYCPSGGICAFGTTCCGNLCCNQSSKCSPSGGCIPQEANDCGDGHWCNAGTQCWRAPSNIGSIRQGELKCVTPSQAGDLERALIEQLQAERQKKIAEEEERRRNEEQRRVEAKRKEIETQQADARQKLDKSALAQKQASQQLQKSADQQRQAELKRLQALRDEQLSRPAVAGESCDARKISAIALGNDPNKVVCSSSAPSASQPSPQKTLTPQEKAWADQLDYLKRNAVRLQPEVRKVAAPSLPVSPAGPGVCSTFPGARCPTAEEAATEEARRAEEQRKEAARLAEEEQRTRGEWQKAEQKRQEEAAAKEEGRQREAARTAPYTETEPFEDCGAFPPALELTRKNECGAQGGGMYCTRGSRSRTCTPRYIVWVKAKPDCGAWKIVGTPEGFCKVDPPKPGPPPNFCDVNKC